MGLCLSCLGGNDDSDLNERTSLLNENFSDDDLQEDLIKQQKRQNELSVIVNDLTENLIDASSFLSRQENSAQTEENPGLAASPNLAPSSSDDSKQLPCIWSVQKKIELMKDISMSHETFDVQAPANPLYVVF